MSNTVTMSADDRALVMGREPIPGAERPSGASNALPGGLTSFRIVVSNHAGVVSDMAGRGADRPGRGPGHPQCRIEVFSPSTRFTMVTAAVCAVGDEERSSGIVPGGPNLDIEPRATGSRSPRKDVPVEPCLMTDAAGPGEDMEVLATSTMGSGALVPTARRPDLVLGLSSDGGGCVVKDPRAGSYYNLGRQEAFLLSCLDGRRTAAAIRAEFEAKFGEPFSDADLEDFLALALSLGWLRGDDCPGSPDAGEAAPAADRRSNPPRPRARQSVLYWRLSLFDPDRLCGRLEPWLGFLWTRGFLTLSALAILGAFALAWTDRQALVTRVPYVLRWDTVALAWLTLAVVTTCHEFAHGLTCKHYGGEVHEIGFLLMYGLPCFFCNVSDAWLFREKAKRLWVTLAGGYCDLVLWALAVFTWRLTTPDSVPNYIAWVALSVLGVRAFFNFNPLLKLDGYYLLSDWLEVPNLRQRAWDSWLGFVRWGLWGGRRPTREPRGRFLLGFGAACWLYMFFMLSLVGASLWRLAAARGGWLGAGWMGLLGVAMVRSQFRGIAGGEVTKMIQTRHKRTAVWVIAIAGAPALLSSGRIEDRIGGSFQVRPVSRAELRAPVAGFLREVHADEGDRVSPGQPVALLEIPDLESRIARKQAERRESQARVRLLEIGPRPEDVEAQRQRVGRAQAWRDLAQRDLQRAEQVLAGDLARLDEQRAQHRAERDQARDVLARARRLRERSRGAVSEEELGEAETKCRVCEARVEQVDAERRARRAQGALEAETELALREKQLAEAQATLALLEAGTRPEELDAERARLARLDEELRYEEGLRARLAIASPVSGVVVTPQMKEKVGQYFREGELIGEVKSPTALEAQIAVAEYDAERIQVGQRVELKARGLPFRTFHGRVDRIAPVATPGDVQSTLTVYCRPDELAAELRPGMTGYARIAAGRRSLGEIALDRLLRVLRTEFWW